MIQQTDNNFKQLKIMENRQYGCGPWGWRGRRHFDTPPVNISETEHEYTISLYAPSLIKENISITTQNDILSIRYNEEKNPDSQSYTRREYRTEKIERSFDLKGKVDVDQIRATYTDGVLKISLPKTTEAKRPSQKVNIS